MSTYRTHSIICRTCKGAYGLQALQKPISGRRGSSNMEAIRHRSDVLGCAFNTQAVGLCIELRAYVSQRQRMVEA